MRQEGSLLSVVEEFKAVVFCNEINLNKIAQHFGINRKLKWEDSLALKEQCLAGIVNQADDKIIYIFHFGSMVFINFQHHEIMDAVNYLKKIEPDINTANVAKYVDDYKLEVNPAETPAINNDYMVTGEEADYQLGIVSTILAKSVALEKTEIEIDKLLDDIEDIVNKLHQGELAVSDEKLAKLSANILGFKLNTISYLMLLDKPEITWNNEEAAALFDQLSELFELSDRYEKNQRKTETLMDITEVFSGLVHSQRGTRLEWAIIILIVIETCLSLFDLFVKYFSHG